MRRTRVGVLAAALVCVLAASSPAQSRSDPRSEANAQQTAIARDVIAKAARGEMTPDEASSALYKAGMGPQMASAFTEDAKAAWDKSDRGKADAARMKKEEDARKNAPPPGEAKAKSDWAWGDLIAGRSYPTALVVTNECQGQETVTITVNSLPLTAPKTATIPGKKSAQVAMTIDVPAIPAHITFAPDAPPWAGYWIFTGTVTVVHPAKVTPPCQQKTETYTVTGHGHEPPPDPGPSKLARVSDCELRWQLSLPPTSLGDAGGGSEQAEACLEQTRKLATAYRTRVLPPHVAQDAAAWSWLPTVDDIARMAVAPLFGMKARADAQMAGTPAAANDSESETSALLRASIHDIVSGELAPLAAKIPQFGHVPSDDELNASLASLDVRQLVALRSQLRTQVDSAHAGGGR